MAATTSNKNATIPGINRKDELAQDVLDPLPDETVVKAGWLNKKGRRGVRVV